MSSKRKTSLWFFILIFLHLAKVESLSFNQPKFCPNASWNPNGTIFAQAKRKPYGLFVHINNTVYATEQTSNRVQIWSNQGGNATKTISSSLSNPAAIFVTTDGTIYVDNGDYQRVERWTTTATDGVIVMTATAQCMGLFIDMNNTLFCAASDKHQVVAQSLNEGEQSLTVVAGNGTQGSDSNHLCNPNGIFVDGNFNLYVADYCNSRVQKFKPGQLNGQTVAGNGASGTIDLNGPTAVVLDADSYLFITDTFNNRIVGSGPNGFRCIAGCSKASGSLVSQFQGARSLAFDSYGNLFVADRENDRILKFTLETNFCDQDITSTGIQMTNATVVTYKTKSATTNQQITSEAIPTSSVTPTMYEKDSTTTNQQIISSAIPTSSVTPTMYEKDSTATNQQIHNSTGRAYGFASYCSLWLILVAFQASV